MYQRRRQWHPTPVLLLGKSHGWRSLVGCSLWGREGWTRLSDFTFTFHFSLSCIGEGNGNPLQCSCLENPRDGGAWWAAVYGVAQTRTRLKRRSSSSSSYVSGIVVGTVDKAGKKTESLCSWWWSALGAILEIQQVKECGRILASKQEFVSGQT